MHPEKKKKVRPPTPLPPHRPGCCGARGGARPPPSARGRGDQSARLLTPGPRPPPCAGGLQKAATAEFDPFESQQDDHAIIPLVASNKPVSVHGTPAPSRAGPPRFLAATTSCLVAYGESDPEDQPSQQGGGRAGAGLHEQWRNDDDDDDDGC